MWENQEGLRRSAPAPLYEQLAGILARRIDDGHLPAGERLPGELSLATEFAVSRDTIREALGVLERRGLIERRRGKGTFVAAARVSQDLAALRSFRGGLLERGVVPTVELLEFHPVPGPADVAPFLGTGEVMLLKRRYVVDGRPFALAEIWMHSAARTLSWDLAERYDTYALFERFLGTPVAQSAAAIRAEKAARAHARLLAVAPGAPLLVLEQTQISGSGQPLAFSTLRLRADAYEFRLDLPAGAGFADRLGLAGAGAGAA